MRRPSPRLAAAPLAALLVAPRAAHAQAALTGPPVSFESVLQSIDACAARIPRDSLKATAVFAHAEVYDSADSAARPTIDLIAQEVAAEMRRAISQGSDAPLPSTDAASWTDGPAHLHATARRGRPLSWQGVPYAQRPVPPLYALADSALRRAERDGAVFVVPDVMRGDSLVFELYVDFPGSDAFSNVRTALIRNASPAFAILAPSLVPVRADPAGSRPPVYHNDLLFGGLEAVVTLNFVVDETGHPVSTTMRDVWPSTVPPLEAHLRPVYADFVGAVRDAVQASRYFPARLGGCPIAQAVQQRFVMRVGVGHVFKVPSE